MKRIYLDYAASTPVDAEVFNVMKPYFSPPPGGKYGNPGSLHYFGQEAMAAVDKSRETIAKAVGAPPVGGFRQIIFTGSATEANNLALRGAIGAARPKIVISSIEHESVLDTARRLGKDGVEAVILPVNKEGFVDLEELKTALDEQVVLVSVMYAQNEIGTIQPIVEISKLVKNFNPKILVHTDAVQAFQFLDCNVDRLGVDLMTLSAHKIYGPKGVGALYVRGTRPLGPRHLAPSMLAPIITGGGQEFGLRSGTENVASIAGFAKAVELALKNRQAENKRITELKNYFWQELSKEVYPKAEINGCQMSNVKCQSLPNILNIYFPGQDSQDLLIKFDLAGLTVSAGAACSAHSVKPSHVLQALGYSLARVKSSIRFSFGKFTTEAEVKEALKRIKKILK